MAENHYGLGRLRRLILGTGAILIALGFVASRQTRAAPLEASWQVYGRANVASFAPGLAPLIPPAGYEIVSFDAVGLAAGLATYVYGGPDLPAEHGGPGVPLVDCVASYTSTELDLAVSGAYPYAGCVFFIAVSNTGEGSIRIELGSLDANAEIECNVPGCLGSDIEMLAGSAGEDPISACSVSGGAVLAGGSVYSLQPGATVVCPLFVIVLQPAKEGAVYVVTIVPPALEPAPDQPLEVIIPDSSNPARPPAEQPPESVPPAASATPSPTQLVAGERTPGTLPTPLAPATGSGIVVTTESSAIGGAPATVVLVGIGLTLAALWPRRRST